MDSSGKNDEPMTVQAIADKATSLADAPVHARYTPAAKVTISPRKMEGRATREGEKIMAVNQIRPTISVRTTEVARRRGPQMNQCAINCSK